MYKEPFINQYIPFPYETTEPARQFVPEPAQPFPNTFQWNPVEVPKQIKPLKLPIRSQQ